MVVVNVRANIDGEDPPTDGTPAVLLGQHPFEIISRDAMACEAAMVTASDSVPLGGLRVRRAPITMPRRQVCAQTLRTATLHPVVLPVCLDGKDSGAVPACPLGGKLVPARDRLVERAVAFEALQMHLAVSVARMRAAAVWHLAATFLDLVGVEVASQSLGPPPTSVDLARPVSVASDIPFGVGLAVMLLAETVAIVRTVALFYRTCTHAQLSIMERAVDDKELVS